MAIFDSPFYQPPRPQKCRTCTYLGKTCNECTKRSNEVQSRKDRHNDEHPMSIISGFKKIFHEKFGEDLNLTGAIALVVNNTGLTCPIISGHYIRNNGDNKVQAFRIDLSQTGTSRNPKDYNKGDWKW